MEMLLFGSLLSNPCDLEQEPPSHWQQPISFLHSTAQLWRSNNAFLRLLCQQRY